MASSAAALNGTVLVAAMFLVLLHPSMERQPGPVHHCHDPPQGHQPPEGRGHECDDDTDQQPPPPTPTPTPTPSAPPPQTPSPPPPTAAPPLPPTPTTAPTSAPPSPDCSSYCNNQCYPPCQGNQTAGYAQCRADGDATAKLCYDMCSNNTCSQSPDKIACLNSGCSYNNCTTCGNTYTSSCCSMCGQAPMSQYTTCVHHWDLFLGYCIMDCVAKCEKNCPT